jgi:Protein of unknown function (DUF4242)
MKNTEAQRRRGTKARHPCLCVSVFFYTFTVIEFRAVEVNMAQFVIEREVPNAGELSETQIRELSLKSLEVLGQMGPKIRWLHSYVTDNKIYCVYLAADEAAIREHAQKGGFPANRISKVRKLIDPVNFE